MGVIRNKKAFLAFLLPGLLFYILAVFYPIEESIRLSFMKWGGIGKKQFVGLKNYVTMFHDEVFYKAFFNNLIYLVIVVSMQLLIGLFFAILLTYMTKHVTLVKTLYYVPCIITTVAITQLFRSMYSTEPMGLLNQILQKVGLGGMVTSWLAKVSTVLPAVSIPEGWRFTGMYMVIFYAALVSLDPSVYEAAKIDGASEMQKMLHIAVPLLVPTLCALGLFAAVGHWNSWFDAMLYIRDENLRTVQYVIRELLLSSGSAESLDSLGNTTLVITGKVTSEALKMASVVVALIPILCVYPFLQKYFIYGMYTGSVKG